MKILKVSIFLMGCITAVANADEGDWRVMCEAAAEIAETIMERRQTGTSMAKMIEVADDNELVEQIIIAAYDSPRYSTDRIQQRAAAEFRDEVYLQCVKATRPE